MSRTSHSTSLGLGGKYARFSFSACSNFTVHHYSPCQLGGHGSVMQLLWIHILFYSLLSLSGVVEPMKISKKCNPHLMVLWVGSIALWKINQAQKSNWIQNNYGVDPVLPFGQVILQSSRIRLSKLKGIVMVIDFEACWTIAYQRESAGSFLLVLHQAHRLL